MNAGIFLVLFVLNTYYMFRFVIIIVSCFTKSTNKLQFFKSKLILKTKKTNYTPGYVFITSVFICILYTLNNYLKIN